MCADRFGDFMKKLRFLIINEYKNCGGTEISVRKIRQILTSHGHEVFLIYMHVGQDEILSEKEYVLNPRFGIFDKFFYNPIMAHKLKQILNTISPDLILVNNVFSAPITVFSTLRGYKVYQFIRDYWPICPKSTCMLDSGKICKGFILKKCVRECSKSVGFIPIVIKLLLLKYVHKLRLSVVSKCFPPGKLLSDYMSSYGYKSIAINNPSQYEECPQKILNNTFHRYIYLGAMNDNKGIYEMMQAFEHFSLDKTNVELHMYGRFSTEVDKQKTASFTERCKNIVYNGSIAHDEVQKILRDAYALIVPSKWLEAFGNTVMEGMANRLLVLGTSRGGTLEQLSDGRGILFDISTASIYEALNKAEMLSEAEYIEITNRAYEHVLTNNSYEMYYSRLISEISDGKKVFL